MSQQTTSRRAFLKTLAGGAAVSAMLATSRIADGARPYRETGSVPSLTASLATSKAKNTAAKRTRFECRSPE